MWHPAFSGQAADLLGAVVERCADLEIAVLHVYLADCDDDQKQLLAEVGFGEEARFKRRLRVDGRVRGYGRVRSDPSADGGQLSSTRASTTADARTGSGSELATRIEGVIVES